MNTAIRKKVMVEAATSAAVLPTRSTQEKTLALAGQYGVEKNLSSYGSVRRGELYMAADFLPPHRCYRFGDYWKRVWKWLLASGLTPAQTPKVLATDEWNVAPVSVTAKGYPCYPMFQLVDQTAYVVVPTPQYKFSSKLKRLIWRADPELPPYAVMPNGHSLSPLYDLSTRLGGFDIQVAAIALNRFYEDVLEFRSEVAGKDIYSNYSFVVKNELVNPVAFYLYVTQHKGVQEQFESEVRRALRQLVENRHEASFGRAAFSLRGTFSIPLFCELGYAEEAEYEISYVSH